MSGLQSTNRQQMALFQVFDLPCSNLHFELPCRTRLDAALWHCDAPPVHVSRVRVRTHAWSRSSWQEAELFNHGDLVVDAMQLERAGHANAMAVLC